MFFQAILQLFRAILISYETKILSMHLSTCYIYWHIKVPLFPQLTSLTLQSCCLYEGRFTKCLFPSPMLKGNFTMARCPASAIFCIKELISRTYYHKNILPHSVFHNRSAGNSEQNKHLFLQQKVIAKFRSIQTCIAIFNVFVEWVSLEWGSHCVRPPFQQQKTVRPLNSADLFSSMLQNILIILCSWTCTML